jgi:hypothetical protein
VMDRGLGGVLAMCSASFDGVCSLAAMATGEHFSARVGVPRAGQESESHA